MKYMKLPKYAIYIICMILIIAYFGCFQRNYWDIKPLTYKTYKNVLDGDIKFREFAINYHDMTGIWLYKDCTGTHGGTFYLNVGDLMWKDGINTFSEDAIFYGREWKGHESRHFQYNELAHLFDYIQINKDYFFNDKEMKDVKLKYTDIDMRDFKYLEGKRYNFSIVVYYPNGNHNEVWMISKNVDELDDVMKGLHEICSNPMSRHEPDAPVKEEIEW